MAGDSWVQVVAGVLAPADPGVTTTAANVPAMTRQHPKKRLAKARFLTDRSRLPNHTACAAGAANNVFTAPYSKHDYHL